MCVCVCVCVRERERGERERESNAKSHRHDRDVKASLLKQLQPQCTTATVHKLFSNVALHSTSVVAWRMAVIRVEEAMHDDIRSQSLVFLRHTKTHRQVDEFQEDERRNCSPRDDDNDAQQLYAEKVEVAALIKHTNPTVLQGCDV